MPTEVVVRFDKQDLDLLVAAADRCIAALQDWRKIAIGWRRGKTIKMADIERVMKLLLAAGEDLSQTAASFNPVIEEA